MSRPDRIVVACSCEGTMPLDENALAKGCGDSFRTADNLCRRQLDLYGRLLASGAPLTVGCTQEAPLFAEIAEEAGAADRIVFANVREAAGWSNEAAATGPKMAALLAVAAEPAETVAVVSMESAGVVLVYGRDGTALEAARRLADRLDVTVLLTKPGEVTPPRLADMPVLKGTIVAAKGHLGAFALTVDDYAVPAPSSRRSLVFGPPRDGAASTCDLILDLTGGPPLFSSPVPRPGYLRADPRDALAVERLLGEAAHLVGTFDKPRYIRFEEGLCAHSRSRIVGCTRCLDLCPTGAIAPAGDRVAIDPYVCAGCGACAAACPTGAAAAALPPADALLRRLRTLLRAYREAGGLTPVILFHDGGHGEPLIDALARFGDGLPAHVLPVRLESVGQVGPEALAAAFAYGAAGVRLVAPGKPGHDLAGLDRTLAMVDVLLAAYGYGAGLCGLIETDDPDALRAALDAGAAGTPARQPASFLPAGGKRGLLELTVRELHRAAPVPVDVVPLPPGAPFGGLAFDAAACTLCLACVGACPAAALSDNPDRPMLRFTESLCVQCGLCAATCPEDAIALVPRFDVRAFEAPPRLLKEEEPFPCAACGKPFGTRTAIERVTAKLSGSHWMFSGEAGRERLRVLTLCEDCRVEAVLAESFDPHAGPERPKPRTTEDYLRERDGGGESR